MTRPKLLFRSERSWEGFRALVTPENSPLKHISFGRLLLSGGRRYRGQTGEKEVVLDILAGSCEVQVNFEGETHAFGLIGERRDVFQGNPTLLCIPPEAGYEVLALSPKLDIAVSAAPAPPGREPLLIPPEEIEVRLVGAGNWERLVRMGTVGKGVTQRLMVGETIHRPGCWSVFPPHKHDEDLPGEEMAMEEVYFYIIRPKTGFGIQCLYDPPNRPDRLEEAIIVRDGDAVVLPRGYHPVVSAPGYQFCYVWVLYAEKEIYGVGGRTDDPAHAWLFNVEVMLKWPNL